MRGVRPNSRGRRLQHVYSDCLKTVGGTSLHWSVHADSVARKTPMQTKTSAAGILIAITLLCPAPDTHASAQYAAARTPDGNPDLNGIWQAMGSAHWDLEDHAARHGPVEALGRARRDSGPGSAWSKAARSRTSLGPPSSARRTWRNWLKLDPAVKCFMPGIPRATYMPLPFQIVQTPTKMLFAYEFGGNSRIVWLDRPDSEALAPSWMGYSLGRWGRRNAGR